MWYYEKDYIAQKAPSRSDGVDLALELEYRKEGARFLMDMGAKMGLRYDTIATGMVFFHRFYMCQSFVKFDRWVVAAVCLLLAGKVEETPKKCKDIYRTAKALLSDEQVKGFGDAWKDEMLIHERVLLQSIRFDLQVSHPYGFILKFAKAFKGDRAKVQKVVQMAWTFVNDSFCTTVCLQWLPHVVAVALLNLASRLSKIELHVSAEHVDPSLPAKAKWWDHFLSDCTEELLEEISQDVVKLYRESEEGKKKVSRGSLSKAAGAAVVAGKKDQKAVASSPQSAFDPAVQLAALEQQLKDPSLTPLVRQSLQIQMAMQKQLIQHHQQQQQQHQQFTAGQSFPAAGTWMPSMGNMQPPQFRPGWMK